MHTFQRYQPSIPLLSPMRFTRLVTGSGHRPRKCRMVTGRTIPGLLPPNGRAHASTQNAGQVVQESSGFCRPGYPHDVCIARLASTDRERPAGKQPRVSEFHDPQFFGHSNASDWSLPTPLLNEGALRLFLLLLQTKTQSAILSPPLSRSARFSLGTLRNDAVGNLAN